MCWCSDHFELACRSQDVVRLMFAVDAQPLSREDLAMPRSAISRGARAENCPRWVKTGKTRSEHISSEVPPIADVERTCRQVRYVPKGDVPLVHFDCAIPLAMARMLSMKRFASGVSIRSFKVINPIGIGALGKGTGSALS
jgi:hypothetical protein